VVAPNHSPPPSIIKLRIHPCFAVLLLALIAFAPSRAEAAGTWTTVISPAAGGTKTAISISNSGAISTGFTNPGGTVTLFGAQIAVSGAFGSPAGAWSFSTTTFSISPIG